MQIKTIDDYHTWTTYFNDVGSPSFHHSWEWGQFQKKLGNDVLYLGLYDKEQLQTICLVLKIRAKRGNFLFIPHGPIMEPRPKDDQSLAENYQKKLAFIVDYLKDIARKENFSFIRIAPILEDSNENRKIFSSSGFRTAPIYMHAERLWALDITKSEDELLAGMRKTTRYLVKKAIKDGVTIIKRTDDQAVSDFWNIYKETFTREHFTPFSKRFITEEFKTFYETDRSIFLFGRAPKKFDQEGQSENQASISAFPNENKMTETDSIADKNHNSGDIEKNFLASALIILTKSTAFYHQGASIHTKLPVPYLMQWEAIKETKRRGCKTYNFYGILQPGRTPKAWSGLTLFKQGFGGYQIDYVPTQDLILSPKYYLSYLYEKYLNFKRGV